MIKSLSTPDRYERAVAFYVNTFDNVTADRPTVSTKYPDVKIQYKNKTSWLEVKMNEQDQMGGPRVLFDGSSWTGKDSPIQNFTCDILNSSEEASNFIDDVRRICSPTAKLPTTRGGLKGEDAVSLQDLREFFSDRVDQYICRVENVDLGDLITKHYNFGKTEAAHYIQCGDQFFAIGDTNPFDLDVPRLTGTGVFKVRIQLRTDFYEIIPEIKLRGEMYSPFSVAPGTLKPHPFVYTH